MEEIARETVRSMPAADPKVVAQMEREQAKKQKQAEEARKKEERDAKLAQQRMAALDKNSAQSKEAKKDPKTLEAEMTLNLHKIRLYYEKLGHKLTSQMPKTLPKTPEAARVLKDAIECELQSTGGIESAAGVYMTGVQLFEQSTQFFNPLDLQLSGPYISLTQAAAQNQDKLNDLVTEFAIQHSEWFMFSPLRRLVHFTITMAMQVSAMNKQGITGSKPAPEDLRQQAQKLKESL